MKFATTARVLVFTMFLSLTCFLSAQEVASLTGVVTDRTGAVIQGVSVRLVDTKTNANYATTTNAVGGYAFYKLLPGPDYKVTFDKVGFERLTVSNIYLAVGATHTQNAELEIGQVTESVEVSAADSAVSLDTTDTVIGNNVDMRMVHELPIIARESPTALLDFQPGVIDTNVRNDDNGSREGAVTGARGDQNNVMLDGLDVNDFATGQAFATVGNAPVDSVQEFRVETANPLAATGRGAGAQVQLVTKSGSNNWHGGAFEYLRNTVTEANTFFNDRNSITKPKLIQNSFGADLGGPIVKDKLFFFFDYQGRRDATEASVLQTVPLDSYRNGLVSYIHTGNDINGQPCTNASRANTQPTCINTVSSANAKVLDPQGTGADQGLLTFIQGRYPHANDLTAGDGVNTGGFRFNSPVHRTINDYVSRIDYNLNSKMKLFGRFSILRDNGGDDQNFQAPVQFPGDPITHEIIDTSYAYVIGHTWTISPTQINQFYYGETRSQLNFPFLYNPTGVNYFQVFGPLSTPYENPDAQHRIIPIPVFRDDFTYTRGTHNIQVGGTFKPIKTQSQQIFDYNLIAMGLGQNLSSLSASQRPNDLLPDPIAQNLWDSSFVFALGRFQNISTNVNYGHDLQPLPLGTGHTRRYRYYETELYLQDTWRMRNDLTMTYGLRWQYYSVPYEVNGFEATPNQGFSDFFNPRLPLGAAGSTTPLPLTRYDLAGKVNHGPGLYHPNWRDFAPRLSFAYNPSFSDGFLGRFLGNRKTVIRTGAGVVFDHPTTNAVNFVQDQASYLFQNNVTTSIPGDLATDPRFVDTKTLPPLTTPPVVTRPFTPFVIAGLGGIGAALGQANYAIDPHLKTPYQITFTFGIQRELPGNFLFESTYFARLGRRLLAQADAGQVVDFKDPTSHHTLAADFADLSKQLRAGVDPQTTNVAPEPFFENQIGAGGTQFVAQSLQTLVTRGDLGDAVQQLAFDFFTNPNGGLAPGVGMAPQFATNAYITNKSFSNYNGLLTSLHKRLSHGLQFDLNYTFAHSIDNTSATANNIFGTSNFAGGLICNVTNLRVCRGNSDFDVTHVVSATGIWELPVGRGRQFANTLPGWLNQMVGGWQLSGIDSWHTGFAFTSVANAFPLSFDNNVPAIFNGDNAAIATHIHTDPATGAVQLFADQTKAMGAFRGPLGLEAGQRNSLRGPRYSDVDLGLAKHFPIRDKFTLEFRADAFNVFNHTNFNLPGLAGNRGTADITNPSQFGVITSTADSRQMQFALRLDF